MKILLLTLILMSSFGCGKKSSNRNKNINQIFVKGNPLLMIEGTTKNRESFLTIENLSQFDNSATTGISIFSEKEVIEPPVTDIEEGQEAQEHDETERNPTIFRFVNLGNGKYSFSSDMKFDYIFTVKNSKLVLTALEVDGEEASVIPEHYSVSKDGRKFSFMARLKTVEDGEVLISSTFYKPSLNKFPTKKVDSKYKYLYGPGVVVPWKLDEKKEISIDVCPSNTIGVGFNEIKNYFKRWDNKHFQVKVTQMVNCKPFSDVEQHALYYVDNYLTLADENYGNPGFAINQADLSRSEIFDADIILLGAEIKKLSRSNGHYPLERTLTHEFGHFLGLHHQFDGTSSIMSYDDIKSIETYDKEAISLLYAN